MGLMLSNAIQKKKSYKRFVGDFEDDEEFQLADDIADIFDRFVESMNEVFEFNESELDQDFPELSEILKRQINLTPKKKQRKHKRNHHDKHGKGHKHHKHSSKPETEPEQPKNQEPEKKWETIGRKLNFLSNRDNFHDEIQA
jgi:exonuclease V gamma subunit